MFANFKRRNRRGRKFGLDENGANADAMVDRLKQAFQVDPRLDDGAEARITSKIDDKISRGLHDDRSRSRNLRAALAGGLLVVMIGAVLITKTARFGGIGSKGRSPERDNPSIASDLPVVGSFAKLKALLAKAERMGLIRHSAKGLMLAAPLQGLEGSAEKAIGLSDYSTTNVQVEGVDEADTVKTDGSNIYRADDRRVVIARVYPADRMKVLAILNYEDGEFFPMELYVDGKRLAVIGRGFRKGKALAPGAPAPSGAEPAVPYDYQEDTTKVIVYDLRDGANPQKIREVELDGVYLSSRKIGSALYLVSSKYVDVYRIQREATETANADSFKPSFRDSARGDGFKSIDYSEIRYFPGAMEPNYLMVAGLDLDNGQEPMRVSTFVGGGQNVYASAENLYVASSGYRALEARPSPGRRNPQLPLIAPIETRTDLYRFGLDGGRVYYKAKGEVPGTLLNQFSMDEHKGYFRVATTKGEDWSVGEGATENNVYVLNEDMSIAGKLENVAPGERIYSVRFMGDRAYMVTFKKVDPFFVIDLADPRSPKILGALKIPGYSDYLHPYDENHIIGFGKETVELPAPGQDYGSPTIAYYQGMKMAMFDVTDVKRPIEKFKAVIGDRGTDSELLRNHKALLFDKVKNLLAFPVTVIEAKGTSSGGDEPQAGIWPEYGSFVFQGAYIYDVSLDRGFELKGKITHLTGKAKGGLGGVVEGPQLDRKQIERILYIGDTLYTVSRDLIKANRLSDLKEESSLSLN